MSTNKKQGKPIEKTPVVEEEDDIEMDSDRDE